MTFSNDRSHYQEEYHNPAFLWLKKRTFKSFWWKDPRWQHLNLRIKWRLLSLDLGETFRLVKNVCMLKGLAHGYRWDSWLATDVMETDRAAVRLLSHSKRIPEEWIAWFAVLKSRTIWTLGYLTFHPWQILNKEQTGQRQNSPNSETATVTTGGKSNPVLKEEGTIVRQSVVETSQSISGFTAELARKLVWSLNKTVMCKSLDLISWPQLSFLYMLLEKCKISAKTYWNMFT